MARSAVNLSDMHSEYQNSLIGPKIYEFLSDLIPGIIQKYPPAVYNNDQPWGSEAHSELAYDVVKNLLLNEGQIHTIFETSQEIDDVRRMFQFQVIRALSRRRVLTVVEHIMSQFQSIASVQPFFTSLDGEHRYYALETNKSASQDLREERISAALAAGRNVPRLISDSHSEPAPSVYRSSDLEELLRVILNEVDKISEYELRRIIEDILTPWLIIGLEDAESSLKFGYAITDIDLEIIEVRSQVKAFVASLPRTDLSILSWKTQGLSDDEIGRRLNQSCLWVSGRKSATLQHLNNNLMAGLQEIQRDSASTILLEEVSIALRNESK